MRMTLREVAERVGGEVVGEMELTVSTIAGLEQCGAEALVWVEHRRDLKVAEATSAVAVIVPRSVQESTKPLIRVENPRLAYAILAGLFFPPRAYAPGVHPTAVIAPSARLGEGVSVQPLVVIEDEVEIGPGAVIGAGAFVGRGARIGAQTCLLARAVVADECVVGERCLISYGAVIGGDGFGFVADPTGRHLKVPQVGRVVIGDEVEVGSNTTIDRGTFGDTVIGRGVKIDNLVQIAHNDQIGENSVLCAQVGLSGSVTLGRNVMLAGQVGIADHVQIGDRVMMAGKSGLAAKKRVPSDQILLGAPARPLSEARKLHAWQGRVVKRLMARQSVDPEEV